MLPLIAVDVAVGCGLCSGCCWLLPTFLLLLLLMLLLMLMRTGVR
jgi:hypothetical protein